MHIDDKFQVIRKSLLLVFYQSEFCSIIFPPFISISRLLIDEKNQGGRGEAGVPTMRLLASREYHF